jgi:hypothetical protein
MNDILRERLIRKLDSLPDERIYQIFDYIDFLESRYAQRTSTSPNRLQQLAEGMEDTLRAGKVSASAVAGTMNIVGKAVGAINTVASAGKSVATELGNVASGIFSDRPGQQPGSPSATGQSDSLTVPAPPPGEQRK